MAGEYQLPLSDAQIKRIKEAKNAEELRLAYVAVSEELAEQQLAGLGLENAWDASGARVKSDALPADPEIVVRFPGVDPRGKYSPLDMRFAQRMDRITSTLALRGEDVRDRFGDLMVGRTFTDIERRVEPLAREQRKYMRAEKICVLLASDDRLVGDLDAGTRKAAADVAKRNLHQHVATSEADDAVVDMENMVTSMEYLLGIRTGNLSRDCQQFCTRNGIDVSPAAVEKARKVAVPESLEIKHPYFENLLAEQQVADPANWGRPPREFTQLSSAEIGRLVTPYLRATEGQTLDAMFSGVEEGTRYTESGVTLYGMDRSDYVIVGGRTVKERLREMFENGEFPEHKDENFDLFYGKEGHRLAAEYVGGALTAGERVEAFIPNELGEIPDKPVSLKASGFEPARLAPATLNVWERFWNMFGFYKEKAAQVEEQARFNAAYERVKLRDQNTRVKHWESETSERVLDEFFRDYKKENFMSELPIQSARGYTLARTAWPTFATLKLLGDGYELADILDPTKLQAEKQQAGKDVIGIVGDVEKEKDLFRKGAEHYIEQIDKMAQKFDFSKPETFASPEFRPMLRAFYVGFDAWQEVAHLESAFTDAGQRAEFEQIDKTLYRFGNFGNAIELLHATRASITTREPIEHSYQGDFKNYLYASAVIQTAGKQYAALAKGQKDGKVPLSAVVTDDFAKGLRTLKSNMWQVEEAATLAQEYREDPKQGAVIQEAVRSGSLMKNVKFSMTVEGTGRDEMVTPKFELPKGLTPEPQAKTQKQVKQQTVRR